MTKVLKSYQFLFALNGQKVNITVLDDLTDSLTSKYKWNNRDTRNIYLLLCIFVASFEILHTLKNSLFVSKANGLRNEI